MFELYFEGLKDPTAKALPSSEQPGPFASFPATVGADGVSREFDPLFTKHGNQLPVPFLRALAKRESNLNPNDQGGSFWGILQVGFRGRNAVLKGFNRREKTSFVKEDLLNPDINTRIAADLLNRITNAYRGLSKENPLMMQNMIPNFSNKEFVKLLLAGWNSGYSRAGGVQRVARFLAKRGIPVTHDAVFKNATRAGATRFLRGELDHAARKRKFQRGVADLFFRMDDFTPEAPASVDTSKDLFVTTTPRETPRGKLPTGSRTALALAAPAVLLMSAVALLGESDLVRQRLSERECPVMRDLDRGGVTFHGKKVL